MDNILMAHFITEREYFRYNEIAYLSNVKISSLRRILERLQERGWIEKSIPRGRVFHFTTKKEARQETYKEFVGIVGFPSDKRDLFKNKLREHNEKNQKYKIPKLEKEKNLRKGRIKGRKKIFVEASTEKKEIVFYKIKQYPYVYQTTKNSEQKIKDGSKRFWRKSAKEFLELKNSFFKNEIKRAGLVDLVIKNNLKH